MMEGCGIGKGETKRMDGEKHPKMKRRIVLTVVYLITAARTAQRKRAALSASSAGGEDILQQNVQNKQR